MDDHTKAQEPDPSHEVDAIIPPHSTTEQLRHDIDSGRTGDKVAVSDPAAAPLGTDEEAAGTPVDPAIISKAREVERRVSRAAAPERGLGAAWILVAFVSLAAAVAVVLGYVFA